jgi:predicted DNA-binding transcriptional regulator AlpA
MAYNDPSALFYSFRELRALGYVTDRVTLQRRIDRGQFPAPIRIGSSLRWKKTEIEEWLQARMAERSKQ